MVAEPKCPECEWTLHQHFSGRLACDRCGLHVDPASLVQEAHAQESSRVAVQVLRADGTHEYLPATRAADGWVTPDAPIAIAVGDRMLLEVP